MNGHRRIGGVSAPVYVAMLALGGVALLLEDATGGRSWGLLAAVGALAIADSWRGLRRPGVAAPRRPSEVDRPLQALAGMAAGAAFVVVGVLAATRVIAIGG